MEELEKTLFYKPTGTVQIANQFSLVERKLLNAIIWHSQKKSFKAQELSIPVRDIFELIGLEKSRNNDVLKESLRTLTGTVIEWNTFGEDRATEWGVCTFLASGVIQNGKLKYILNPKIVEQINRPTLYAKIQLLVQSQVRKRHALVLYEFFLDSLSRGKKDSLKIVISLEKLRQLLGVNPDITYKFFNRDVIKPSVREIIKHTDIDVTQSTNRKGRLVDEVVFIVEKRPTFQLSIDFHLPDQDNLEHSQELPAIEHIQTDAQRVELLEYHGVIKKKAQELVKAFDWEQIQGNIEYVLDQQKKGKPIENLQAYLVKAIEEDYRPKKSPKETQEEKQRIEKAKAKTKAQKETAQKKQLQSEWKKFCDQRVKDNFAQQSQEWQSEQQALFVEKIKNDASEGKSILFNSYKKDAFNSPMVQAVFYSELRDQLLLAPEETSFEEFVKSKEGAH